MSLIDHKHLYPVYIPFVQTVLTLFRGNYFLCRPLKKDRELMPLFQTYRDYGDAFSCPICRSTVTNHVNNYSIQNFIDIFKKAELHEINTQNLSSGSISEEDQSSGSGSRSSASTPTRIIESLNVRAIDIERYVLVNVC